MKTPDKHFLACKNQQVSKLLTKLEIPHLNFEHVKVKSVRLKKN
jgi:hypothetical protein